MKIEHINPEKLKIKGKIVTIEGGQIINPRKDFSNKEYLALLEFIEKRKVLHILSTFS